MDKYILECERVKSEPYGEVSIDFGKSAIKVDGEIVNHMNPIDNNKINADGVMRGMNRAQEVYRRLAKLSFKDYGLIFGTSYLDGIIQRFSADEIESELDKYENRIRVGDEVLNPGSGLKGVVTKVSENGIYVMFLDGSCGAQNDEEWVKTGRQYGKISELLTEMENDV